VGKKGRAIARRGGKLRSKTLAQIFSPGGDLSETFDIREGLKGWGANSNEGRSYTDKGAIVGSIQENNAHHAYTKARHWGNIYRSKKKGMVSTKSVK